VPLVFAGRFDHMVSGSQTSDISQFHGGYSEDATLQ
jgi:hypothetical protein